MARRSVLFIKAPCLVKTVLYEIGATSTKFRCRLERAFVQKDAAAEESKKKYLFVRGMILTYEEDARSVGGFWKSFSSRSKNKILV